MGLMFQMGLSWGCFASAVRQGGFWAVAWRGAGAGERAANGRGWGCLPMSCLKKPNLGRQEAGKQALPHSDFQESCRLTLSNIPKRALGVLGCARIAFIWSGNGYVA